MVDATMKAISMEVTDRELKCSFSFTTSRFYADMS